MSTVLNAPNRSLSPARERRGSEVVGRARLAVASRVYLPAFSIVAVAAALVGFGWANNWWGADLASSATSLRTIVIGPVTLAMIGVFLIVERVRPAQRRSLVARGH